MESLQQFFNLVNPLSWPTQDPWASVARTNSLPSAEAMDDSSTSVMVKKRPGTRQNSLETPETRSSELHLFRSLSSSNSL